MRSWVALTRWALTLALGLLLVVAPPAIGQQPITHIYDALGRLVAVVGETSMTFSGTLAQVISATATEIVTTVPAGTATGLISVTTAITGTNFDTPANTRVVFNANVAQGEDGEAEPGDRSRHLDDPDAGPLLTVFVATVAVLQMAVGLQVILRIYGSGLTPQNCRVIIGVGVFASALMRRLWSMIERESDERAKWEQTEQCEVEASDTITMLKRCFEAQYRSLQPNLRALLDLHGADLPFITNPIPPRIVPCVTALWWTDDLMVRKEQRIFMMVKEDVFLQ